MPGILQSDNGNTRAKLAAAVAAELVGTFLFAFIGGAAPYKKAALANGLALMSLVFATANVSGGHLNPAVTIGTLTTGHTSASRAVAYIVAQITGAALAAGAHALLVPKATAVGCFLPSGGATLGQAAGWELFGTLALVLVIYSVAVGEPSFGVAGPAAIGLTVSAFAFTAGPYSGAAFNPARTLGPVLVFGSRCGGGAWRAAFVYVAAQIVGGLLAAAASWPLYGTGLQWGKWWDELEGAAAGAAANARDAIRDGYRRLEGATAA